MLDNRETTTEYQKRGGTRLVHLFPTRSGNLFVAAISVGMWRGYAEFVGHPEWAPRGMKDVPDLLADPELGKKAIEAGQAMFDEMTAQEAMEQLQARGVTCGVMRTARQVYDEECAKGSRMIHQVRYPDGTAVPVPGPAIDGGHRPGARVPSLGTDSRDVLTELGLAADAIDRLCQDGIVATSSIDAARVGHVDPVPPHLAHLVRN